MSGNLDGGVVLTWRQLLDEGTLLLSEAGVEEAGLDAWYLLSAAFNIDQVHFLMDKNRPVFGERLVTGLPLYREYLKRRASRIPLQQILGKQEFMGLPFKVDEHVLIPRQDTEKLVEEVLKDFPQTDLSLLDMCTGSGCIGISLSVLGRYDKVTAVDYSLEALKVAKKNASALFLIQKGTVKSESKKLSEQPWTLTLTAQTVTSDTFLKGGGKEKETVKFRKQQFVLLESDMFTNVDPSERYDVIVSNPPYIPTAVIDGLEPEVREHEPRMALDGAADGLYFYRILAAQSKRYLKDGGSLYLEIGYDQAGAVSGLLLDNGYEDIQVVKDEPGQDRVVKAVWRSIQEVFYV